MRGDQTAGDYLDALMSRESWAKIYKDLIARDEESQQTIRDYLNEFHKYENDSEQYDDDDADEFGDYAFKEDPTEIRAALIYRNKQRFLDILEDLEIVPLHAVDATLKAFANGRSGVPIFKDYAKKIKSKLNDQNKIEAAHTEYCSVFQNSVDR